MKATRIERIRGRLEAVFAPQHLEVFDDSRLHEGHAGARDGKGHFRVRIVSDRFASVRPLERHRMVFRALDEMMKTDIHALSVSALPPTTPPSAHT